MGIEMSNICRVPNDLNFEGAGCFHCSVAPPSRNYSQPVGGTILKLFQTNFQLKLNF